MLPHVSLDEYTLVDDTRKQIYVKIMYINIYIFIHVAIQETYKQTNKQTKTYTNM